jgi:hypothetical protein
MSVVEIKERFAQLYNLRDRLCEEQKKEMEIEEITQWMITQLKFLKALTKNQNVDRSEICMRIEDIICALDIEGECDE